MNYKLVIVGLSHICPAYLHEFFPLTKPGGLLCPALQGAFQRHEWPTAPRGCGVAISGRSRPQIHTSKEVTAGEQAGDSAALEGAPGQARHQVGTRGTWQAREKPRTLAHVWGVGPRGGQRGEAVPEPWTACHGPQRARHTQHSLICSVQEIRKPIFPVPAAAG